MENGIGVVRAAVTKMSDGKAKVRVAVARRRGEREVIFMIEK